MNNVSPLKVFYSYSHVDEPYRIELEKWLKIFERQGLIDDWSDRQITAGDEWKTEINENLVQSQIIILLVSPDFINSDYCYDIETATAIDLDKQKKASVVPVIIRPCLFRETNFSYLQALPKDALPVSKWPDKDEAWLNVSEGLKKLILEINPAVKKMDGDEPVIKNVSKNFSGGATTFDFPVGGFENISESIDQSGDGFSYSKASLPDLIRILFSEYPDLFFTANTIKNWASEKLRFSSFNNHDLVSIEEELENLKNKGELKSIKSKSGDLMYKLIRSN